MSSLSTIDLNLAEATMTGKRRRRDSRMSDGVFVHLPVAGSTPPRAPDNGLVS
jgi:hypothetical protein